MEVMQFGEPDGPQQGSGAAFTCDGKSNCVEHEEQADMPDIQLDDVLLRVEEPQKEKQGGEHCIVDEIPNVDDNNVNHWDYDFEVDGQKLSCDSRDSEDDHYIEQDHFAGPGITSGNVGEVVDTIENGVTCSIGEVESSHVEPNWLEQDEPVAVWVKWRGKWQAGVKCARADWPLSTLKAKPTHDRKKYLVIFFPRRRNYSWADELLVRPINEFPEPIAYRTHKVGVKFVKDLSVPRRFIMQKLVVSLLNVLDQLHSEAVIVNARDLTVWKEFAMEASRCKLYTDLGRMLLKLQNMILQCCLSPDWLQNSLSTWAQRCQSASTAEAVEILKEELMDSILWNEVNSLLNLTAESDTVSEWKIWKHEVLKSFSMLSSISGGGDTEQPSSDNIYTTLGTQNNRKRPKLEVRRAEPHASQMEAQNLYQPMAVEIDSLFFDGLDVNASSLGLGSSRNEVSLEEAASSNPFHKLNNRWDDIVVEAGNSEVIQNKDVEVPLRNGVTPRKSLDSGCKNRQCVAFIEAKGRQCVRQANDGGVYCCVHLSTRCVANLAKAEASPPVEATMCEGTTVLGTKCKHRSLPGSSFCKKHRPKDVTGTTLSSADNYNSLKNEDNINRSDATNCKSLVLSEDEVPLDVEPISFVGENVVNRNVFIKMPDQSGNTVSRAEMLQCIGPQPQDGSEVCLETAKKCSLYCEKHLPSWLKRARNGKSRIISKEVFLDLLRGCRSHEQKVYLHKACELFYKLFKSILSLRNSVPKEVQFQWAISEASKDVRVGECLIKLVSSEKERLRQLWGFSSDKDLQVSSSVERSISPRMANAIDIENENIIKCKICSTKFLDDQALGTHFLEDHKKEAQWLFRGYVCAICLDSFTNKKLLETHVQERHHVQFVEQCMLLQCIPCGSHFGNPDELWFHVHAIHSSSFRLQQLRNPPVDEYASKKPEPCNLNSAENVNSERQSGNRKFICRFCGLKFDLLPDLGRHHQAAHMGANSTGARLSKRGTRFYNYRLKSGRLTRPKFKRGLGATSFKIRNRGASRMKKHIQASNSINYEEIKLQPGVEAAASLGGMAESQCSAVAKLLFSEVKKTKPRPSNSELLSLARSACCKVSLQASLMERYELLPERIYLKAAKLCSEHNIIVEWHQEGYVCPKGCQLIANSPLKSSLTPLSDEALRPRSVLAPDPETNEWTLDECHCIIDSRHFKPEFMEKSIVLCDDISFGQESVPVACVVDENLLGSVHMLAEGSDGQIAVYPWESFTYITKPLFAQFGGMETEQTMQLHCGCSHSTCSSETCDHIYLFNNDYDDAKDIYGKPMKGRFPYDDRGRVILEEGYLIYECNSRCSCSKSCKNRVLQNGVKVRLEVFKTENKGWAVRAGEAILHGTFVCEYIGEVIHDQEANDRCNRNGSEGCCYIYDIDAHNNDMSRLIEEQTPYVIDATNYGNVSRYINHSCSPNLVNHQVLVESMDYQFAHIGLFASKDIAMGEELTYDYQYKQLPGEGCLCLCGSSNCRGRLL